MKDKNVEKRRGNIPGNENEARRSHTEHIYPTSEFTHSRVDTLHVRTSNPQTFSEKLVLERIQQGRGMLSWKGLNEEDVAFNLGGRTMERRGGGKCSHQG